MSIYSRYSSGSSGLSIIEVVIASAVILTVVAAIATAWQTYVKITAKSTERTQAALLVEEASEALQIMRDDSWENNIEPIALNTDYYLIWTGTEYQATTTPHIIQSIFARTLIFEEVERDNNDVIVESGGTVDDGTRKVTVSVSKMTDPPETIFGADLFIHNVYQN